VDIRICAAVSIDSIFVQYVHGDGVFYNLCPGLAALTELGLELDSNDKVERKSVKYAKFSDDGKLLVLAKRHCFTHADSRVRVLAPLMSNIDYSRLLCA